MTVDSVSPGGMENPLRVSRSRAPPTGASTVKNSVSNPAAAARRTDASLRRRALSSGFLNRTSSKSELAWEAAAPASTQARGAAATNCCSAWPTAVDLQPDPVTRAQVGVVGQAERDPRRRAGVDQIAELEDHVLAQVPDEIADTEDHVGGVAVLAPVSVDRQPQPELLRVGHLIGSHQPPPQQVQQLLRDLAFTVTGYEIEPDRQAPPVGDTVVICGPKSAPVGAWLMSRDPVLGMSKQGGRWWIEHRPSGERIGSPSDDGENVSSDVAYVARHYEGGRVILHIAGIHAIGSLGAAPMRTATAQLPKGGGEDRVYATDNAMLLLDGASALPGLAITDERLSRVGQQFRHRYRERLKTGYGYDQEHREVLRDLQAEQDRHRNRPGGYWIAEADPAAADRALIIRQPLATTPWAILAGPGACACP